jgi:hypothetical protein
MIHHQLTARNVVLVRIHLHLLFLSNPDVPHSSVRNISVRRGCPILEQRHQEVFECVAVAVGHRVVGVCVHGIPTVLVLALRTQDVADRIGDALNFTISQNNAFLSFGLKCLSFKTYLHTSTTLPFHLYILSLSHHCNNTAIYTA